MFDRRGYRRRAERCRPRSGQAHEDLADLAGVAVRALVDVAVDHDAGAEAVAEEDEDEIAEAVRYAGQPLGERFPVTGTLSRFEPTVASAFSDDGTLIVVWDRNAAQPEKSGMFLRRFTID